MSESTVASEHPTVSIPRIVVCGAVDDGKSTLLGRLLVETASVPQDDLKSATLADGSVDYSRLTDGLLAEREQGITIDVAFRYLRLSANVRALLADSPGHEQFTRNMAVAASGANVALLVVDAVRGVRTQTLRHAAICVLMGVKAIVVAVNKIDAVKDPPKRIAELTSQLTEWLGQSAELEFVAVSGLTGENVSEGERSLRGALSRALTKRENRGLEELRLPIQHVIRNGTQRFYAGRIASGKLTVGDSVHIWPSAARARVKQLLVSGKASNNAHPGMSVAVELDGELPLGRGDIIVQNEQLPVSLAHLVDLVWLHDSPLDANASYMLRVCGIEVPARVETIRYVTELESRHQLPATTLSANDIGRVEISADRPLFLDSFDDSPVTGSFILCDRLTGDTVAVGVSVHPLLRESEVSRHSFSVNRQQRELLNGVRSCVIWLTGLPGSGKSSIADEVERELFRQGIRTYVLDGDAVRQTLSADLGFSAEDRRENVRRVAEAARMMMDAGLVVLVSLVSPFRADRDAARELFANDDFFEVFVDTPLEVCQSRDPKHLYARAATTQQNQLTGVGQPYEQPLHPEIHLDGQRSLIDNARTIVNTVQARRV